MLAISSKGLFPVEVLDYGYREGDALPSRPPKETRSECGRDAWMGLGKSDPPVPARRSMREVAQNRQLDREDRERRAVAPKEVRRGIAPPGVPGGTFSRSPRTMARNCSPYTCEPDIASAVQNESHEQAPPRPRSPRSQRHKSRRSQRSRSSTPPGGGNSPLRARSASPTQRLRSSRGLRPPTPKRKEAGPRQGRSSGGLNSPEALEARLIDRQKELIREIEADIWSLQYKGWSQPAGASGSPPTALPADSVETIVASGLGSASAPSGATVGLTPRPSSPPARVVQAQPLQTTGSLGSPLSSPLKGSVSSLPGSTAMPGTHLDRLSAALGLAPMQAAPLQNGARVSSQSALSIATVPPRITTPISSVASTPVKANQTAPVMPTWTSKTPAPLSRIPSMPANLPKANDNRAVGGRQLAAA